jgi:hypothetical protein
MDTTDCVLDYYTNACDEIYNSCVLHYIRDAMVNDPKYKQSKQLHKWKQAGVYHFGAAFHYRKENFDARPIPPLFLELKLVAETLTRKTYDIILMKVYKPGEALAKHQDVDGTNMSVACFTFATDKSQLCDLAWYKGKSNTRVGTMRPIACSMWYMSGATNSKFSHQVRPRKDAKPGLRVSVTFRQSVPS